MKSGANVAARAMGSLVVGLGWLVLASTPVGCGDSDSDRPTPPDTSADADAGQDSAEGGTPGPDTDTHSSGEEGQGGEQDGEVEGDSEEPGSAWLGALHFTEIMRNPGAVPDTQGEWLEIHNTSQGDINLQGWLLRDRGSDLHVISAPVIVPASGFVVLANSADPGANGGLPKVHYAFAANELALGNGADQIILEAPDGLVDEVAWGGAGSGWPADEGRALQLRPEHIGPGAHLANDDPSAWCPAPLPYGGGDLGSPAAMNPSCDAVAEQECADDIDNDGDGATDCEDPDCLAHPSCAPVAAGALVITEIMANPEALPDAVGEWFEVYNATDTPVDVRGVVLADLTGQTHEVEGDAPLWVPSGGHFIFAASQDALGAEDQSSVGYVWGPGYSLGNVADAIVLRSGTLVVDQVEWSPALGFVIAEGASLSLSGSLYTTAANNLASSWCYSTTAFATGDLGTPAAANPICIPAGCGNGTVEPGEACDDGNNDPGDGCEPDCTVTPGGCGDGQLDSGEDCDDGNTLSGDGCSSDCKVETPLQPGSVVITELMINPDAVADAVGEWFEVYNPGDSPIDLAGWELSDDAADLHIIAPSSGALVVPPKGYVVLGRNADDVVNGGVAVDYAYGATMTLANTVDRVILRFAGQVVDRVDYAVPAWIVPRGASLQLSPQALSASLNDFPNNWCEAAAFLLPAGDIGSPGLANPACPAAPICGDGVPGPGEECDDGNDIAGDGCEPDCTLTPPECGNGEVEAGEACDDGNDTPGDGCEPDCTITPKSYPPGALVITEIMANPKGAPDAVGEWFELWNATGEAIDLTGWRLADFGTDNHVIAPAQPLFVAPGEHIVLGNGTSAQNGGVPTVYVASGFILSNSADAIRLFGPDNQLVDQVVYGLAGVFLPEEGIAARLDRELYDANFNDLPDSWCPAVEPMPNGDKGSPGVLNLPCNLAVGCGDGVCQLSESCSECSFDCGPCDMCAPHGGKGCGGCACEACVCAQDPTCCEVAWDGACVLACQQSCGGPDCTSDGCTSSPVPGCGDCACETCVCDWDPACCDVAWDQQCAVLCEACGQDCDQPTGCAASGEPGCDGCACESCVCAQKPSCCTGSWDASCVALCNGCGGPCASNGCSPSLVAGCGGCPCQNCVCAADPFCCTTAWGPECVAQCQACGQDCGSNGCSFSALPGCIGCTCAPCVCAQDPLCCTLAWDESCASKCVGCGEQCPSAQCGNGLIEPGEECDAGVLNSDTAPNACRSNCKLPSCGDGVVDAGEACDDGNDVGGDGCSLECLIEVGFPEPGELVIVEIMYNPAAVFDAQGEWFEVYNASPKALDLSGLEVRDASGANFFVVGNPQFLVQPGALVVFGVSSNQAINGGAKVDYVYPATLVLNNVGPETIELRRGGLLIDAVTYGTAGWPVANGASLSLGPSAWTAVLNDDPANWCLGTTPYGLGDKGTPGASNPICVKCGDGVCSPGEDCQICTADCGPCTSGCQPSGIAGCAGCNCETCVCALDPSCCSLGWDSFCANLCVTQCGGCPTTCGDGVLDSGEQCDDGAANSNTAPDACRTDCTLAKCGDGVLDSGEQCDDGNLLPGDGCSPACVVEALPVNLGDLVVTEIMYNPAVVSDPLGEWFEIYNASNKPVDLNGFAILDAKTDFHIINKTLIIQPKGLVVLGNNGNQATNGGVKVDYQYNNFSLSNTTDEILISFGATVIDIVIYGPNFGFPNVEGRAISLDGTKLDAVSNNGGVNWCLAATKYGAGDYGTPGTVNPPCVVAVCGNGVIEPGEDCDDGAFNSDTEPDACRSNCSEARCGDGVVDSGEACDDGNLVSGDGCEPDCQLTDFSTCGNGVIDDGEECDDGNKIDGDSCSNDCFGQGLPLGPGAAVVTEIMVDPLQVDGSVGEWVELYNPGDSPVNLQYLFVSDAFGGIYKILEPLVIAPKSYGVIAASSNPAINGGVVAQSSWKGALSFPELGLGGVVIESSAGVVDSVYWAPDWPLASGASMSLDPQFLNPQANNVPNTWCLGMKPYNPLDRGTPGAPNPPCASPIICGNGLVQQGEECDDGNLVAGDGCDAICKLEAKSPGPGELAVVEIMANPSAVPDELGEWIELQNVSGAPVDLNGLRLTNSQGTLHVVNLGQQTPLAPGGRWVIGASTNMAINGGTAVNHAWAAGFELSNSQDILALRSPAGIVDIVGYGAFPLWPMRPGQAMQLRTGANPPLDNDVPAGWCLANLVFGAGDLGTPGQPNTECPPLVQATSGNLVISELHPRPLVGDEGEFIEIANTTGQPIDLRGLHITDVSQELHIVTAPEPVWAPAGGVVLLARNANFADNGGLTPAYVYGGFDLADFGDSVVIFAPGTVFDELDYFFPGFPDVLGASLSLDPASIDPVFNDEPSAWCPGAVPYGAGGLGTPGAQNPDCAP